MNLYIYSKPLLFRQRVSFETLFEIPDVMNLSNSDCAARYDVTYLNSHTPANIFFLKDESLPEGFRVLQCSMFFTTERTFLSDGIYIILGRLYLFIETFISSAKKAFFLNQK